MTTIVTHPVIPIVLAVALGAKYVSPRLLLTVIFCSILPDLDVLAFKLGIPYEHMLGHRGFSHSILFAFCIALIMLWFHQWLNVTKLIAFTLVFVSTLSHGLLDAMTNGGLGIAFFAPFFPDRYFLPWQPILVSPIGIRNFLTSRGLMVIHSEIFWVWMPALTAGFAAFLYRYRGLILQRQE